MPRPKWGVCAEPGCPTLTDKGRCDVHRPKPWASSQRRAKLPRNWARLRQSILRRDPWCPCGAPSTEVDHINPVSAGGTDHPENLMGLCHSCHARKTLRDRALATRKGTHHA